MTIFKAVNDTYGHDVGDDAIRILAQTLLENSRLSDIAIRYGGEEFIILLYNCNQEGIQEVAQKIKTAFAQRKIPAHNTTIQKTVSIGTARFPNDSDDLNQCVKYADIALYEAKAAGRDKIINFTKEMIGRRVVILLA